MVNKFEGNFWEKDVCRVGPLSVNRMGWAHDLSNGKPGIEKNENVNYGFFLFFSRSSSFALTRWAKDCLMGQHRERKVTSSSLHIQILLNMIRFITLEAVYLELWHIGKRVFSQSKDLMFES